MLRDRGTLVMRPDHPDLRADPLRRDRHQRQARAHRRLRPEPHAGEPRARHRPRQHRLLSRSWPRCRRAPPCARTIVAGRASVGIEIPPDYARRRLQRPAGRLPRPDRRLRLDDRVADARRGQRRRPRSGRSRSIARRAGIRDLPVQAHPLLLFNPDSRSANLLIPGLIAILLTFSGHHPRRLRDRARARARHPRAAHGDAGVARSAVVLGQAPPLPGPRLRPADHDPDRHDRRSSACRSTGASRSSSASRSSTSSRCWRSGLVISSRAQDADGGDPARPDGSSCRRSCSRATSSRSSRCPGPAARPRPGPSGDALHRDLARHHHPRRRLRRPLAQRRGPARHRRRPDPREHPGVQEDDFLGPGLGYNSRPAAALAAARIQGARDNDPTQARRHGPRFHASLDRR